ncbi:MAG: TolC family protein, partial [Planctomycetota bacterium]
LSTRYEPIATFQIRQPLLRDGWQTVNLAGVDIAKLNYKVALASFRQQTEAVSTEVISLYWALKQVRTDRQIQQKLLEKTQETLERVQDRKDIDASLAQIKQAETSLKRRQAFLYDIEKQVTDVQDRLVRLLADSQTNLLDDYEIVPTTELITLTQKTVFDRAGLLRTAMQQNPVVLQSNLAVEIAQINVDVAKQQKMPKLDMVASTRFSGLDDSYGDAQEILYDGDYNSYAVGLTLEIPLGNRQREAEYRKRLLQRSKAASGRWNISDQVAVAVKEAIRSAETRFEQIQIQQEAVLAATTYLQGLEDTEQIRQQLTPEFLLVKLQAQEALAEAARGEIKAIADYNIALARLAQATGTVLDMRYVKNVLPEITKADLQKDPVN